MANKKFKSTVEMEQSLTLSSQTANKALILDGSGNVVNSAVTDTELAHMVGVTSAIQTQLGAKADLTGGKIPSSQLPALAVTEVYVVADITARDALTIGTGDGEVQEGDVAIVTDASADAAITAGSASYIYDGAAYQLLKAGDEVLSVNGDTGTVVLTATSLNYTQGNAVHWTLATGSTITLTLDEVGSRLNDIETNFFDTSSDDTDNITEGVNKFASASQLAKVDFLTVTQAVDLDSVESLASTATQPADNISTLTNDSSFVDAGGAQTAAVVNSTAGSETVQAPSVAAMKSYVAANGGGGSANDIDETSFAAANNVSAEANVTGLLFQNANVRAFRADVSVEIDATADLFEMFTLTGIQKGSSWDMSVESVGDSSNITFSINAAGQVQYLSGNESGFVTNAIKFRAITTTV